MLQSRFAKISLFTALLLVLVCLLAEWAERGGWNPYVTLIRSRPSTARYPGGVFFRTDASGLYPSAGRVLFATKPDGSHDLGRFGRGKVWVLGGRSTSLEMLPAADRWPALLERPVASFAFPRASSAHSAEVFAELLQRVPAPQQLLVMIGIVDASDLLQGSYASGTLPAWDGTLFEELRRDFLQEKGNALLGLAWFHWNDRFGRNYRRDYLEKLGRVRNLPVVLNADFTQLAKRFQKELLVKRLPYLKGLKDLAQSPDTELVLLTEPNAAFLLTQASGQDLRMTLPYQGRRLSPEQTGALVEAVNQHTREFAKQHKVTLVDTAACLRARTTVETFWSDSLVTPSGSRLVAKCILDAQVLR